MRNNCGVFSARYGNVYTARQFRQLLEWAYGLFVPRAHVWAHPETDSVVDPFRPQIQPNGFLNQTELELDRQQHLGAVRDAVEQADVLIFTLGLTECWVDKRDGAVFPLAPGVDGGRYDPDAVAFANFDETETYADLHAALALARAKNPGLRVILTVSPVPLNATFEPRHVAVSTAWSKAVLRIAAEKATREFSDCVYFPSFEVVTSPQTRGRYYADNRREITEAGVQHVMRLFFRHFAKADGNRRETEAKDVKPRRARRDRYSEIMEAYNQVLCDEDLIDNGDV